MCVQIVPSTPASSTPIVSDGVNRPPGEPAPRQAVVASGLSASSTTNRPNEYPPSASAWTTPLPLPSSSGYRSETAASAPNTTDRRDEPAPPLGPQPRRQLHRPHPAHRGEPDDRSRQQGEHELLAGMQQVVRQVVGRPGPEHDPGDRGGDHRGRERRQHERERDRAEQYLEREQGPAERHVVDRGEPGARSRCHQQPPLPDRQLLELRQPRGDGRPRQLRRRLAAHRRAEPDRDDRDHAASEARQQRQPALRQPQRRRYLRRLRAAGAPEHEPARRSRSRPRSPTPRSAASRPPPGRHPETGRVGTRRRCARPAAAAPPRRTRARR